LNFISAVVTGMVQNISFQMWRGKYNAKETNYSGCLIGWKQSSMRSPTHSRSVIKCFMET